MNDMASLINVDIPLTDGGQLSINTEAGRSVVVLGRNGGGKSALVHYIVSKIYGTIYLPGSRASYFDDENLRMNSQSRSDFVNNSQTWDKSPDTRWKPIRATERNERAIHDLQQAEIDFKVRAADEIAKEGSASTAVDRLQAKVSPVDKVNDILSQANLTVRIVIVNGLLKAIRSGNTYSLAKMSDGERSATILAASVIAADAGNVIVIDEPELHLHRSIVVALVAALVAKRPDCGFLISTHELELPSYLDKPLILLVRESLWQHNDVLSWNIEKIENHEVIPEDLRTDIFGSRQKILFIEGVSTSLDQPLYAVLFPTVSVRSKNSCREIIQAVAGLRSVEGIHRASVFGIIDNDGIAPNQKEEFEAGGVYPLDVFSVESLYYADEVLDSVARSQATTFNEDANAILAAAKDAALASLSVQTQEHLASRVAERHLRDRLLAQMPDRQALKQGGTSPIIVTMQSPFEEELAHIKELVARGSLGRIIDRYPVRESGALERLAQGLKFRGRADYEKAALVRIAREPDLSQILKSKISALASTLE